MKERRIRLVSAAAVHMEQRCVDKSDEDCRHRISCRDFPHGATILPRSSRGNFLPPESPGRSVLIDRSLNIAYALPVMELKCTRPLFKIENLNVRINVER